MKKQFAITTTGLVLAALAVPTIASASSVTVKSGDTLYSIAKKYNLTVNEIKSLNNLTSNTIRPGQSLVVSKTTSASSTTVKKEYRTVTNASLLNVRSGAGNEYKVLTTIKKGTEVEVLGNKNGWYYISVGSTKGYAYSSYFTAPRYVTINTATAVPPTSPTTTTQNTYHTVKAGETLWGISTKYGVPVTTVKSLNKMTTNTIYVGQKLLVKQGTTTSAPTPAPAPSTSSPTTSTTPKVTNYKVVSGDNLTKIANKFNISVSTLKSINGLKSDVIYVGQTLKIEVPQTLGIFARPAEGTITSGFSERWGTFHYGIDFAKAGDIKVTAAADGIVSRSYYSTSYGEVVFIKHTIAGQEYETVYAHMRAGSRAVQVGDRVSSGQFLGWMGSTGDSTGQHLHFEVHKGEWTYNKAYAVDPTLYLK